MENQEPKTMKTIFSFFKKKLGEETSTIGASSGSKSTTQVETSTSVDVPVVTIEPQHPAKIPRITFDENELERDPALRIPIWKHPAYNQDEVRRAYIKWGPNQPILAEYPRTKTGIQNRRFQPSWFIKFPWLEYSISKDAAFCFPCFVFQDREPLHPALTVEGFNSWKRVNNGAKCVFLAHIGCPTSPHNNALRNIEALKNTSRHIDKVINIQSSENIERNRLCLKTTIDSIRWLTLQGCALRGHDESLKSKNRGNLIEMISLMAKLNVEVDKVVLEKAPGNATYTSPMIQKDVLHILATKVRNKIREEVGEARFCILVDEAKDASNKEQMAIVLRFVDIHGNLLERFFDIVHVKDTSALTLKKKISKVLTRHNLHIRDLRGQGYDGASNMRGAWNGLQALFRSDCEYAYYVHCFAHRLQLALVAAAGNQTSVWLFFSKLTCIVNLIRASPKRHTELRSAQAVEIECDITSGERETGRGANQMGSLHRAGTTRWSSHFDSICSLIDMYGATIIVLKSLAKDGSTNTIRGEAGGSIMAMKSFDFIFILHLMQKIMGITDMLCRTLQHKSLDILNAVNLVSSTKVLLQTLREEGFDYLLGHVKSICVKFDVDIPDMSTQYKEATGRSCQQNDHITVEHHYRIDIFNATIDYQLDELHSRFNEESMELLMLSSALDPRDNFKAFDPDRILLLAEKFYPGDFSGQDMHHLKYQLDHYRLDVVHHEKFQNISTMSELCRALIETNKAGTYNLIDRLIRLVLTLPVSTATTERAFSAMKHIKSTLRNKMEDEYLSDSMVVYIEREITEMIDTDSIIDAFASWKDRRVQFR